MKEVPLRSRPLEEPVSRFLENVRDVQGQIMRLCTVYRYISKGDVNAS